MKDKKIFMDGSKLDYHPNEVRAWLKGEQIYPIHVEVSPTSGCNHRCVICCVDYKQHNRQDLTKELMFRIPKDFSEAGVKSYLLAGEGEPFLNKYTVDFVQKAKELGIDGAMTSNGFLFNPKIADATMYGFSWIRFSIQSFNPELYSQIHRVPKEQLKKVMSNIKYAVKLKERDNLETKIGIQQILINENWDDILNSAQNAKDLGVDYWTIKRFSKHPKNTYNVPEDLHKKCEDQFKIAEALSDNKFKVIIRRNQFEFQPRTYNRCIGLPFIVQLLADGKLYPCCQFFDNPKMAYGDLNEATLKEIMSSDRARKITKSIERDYDIEKNKCMTYCRHHSTNLHLLDIINGKKEIKDNLGPDPEHKNFI